MSINFKEKFPILFTDLSNILNLKAPFLKDFLKNIVPISDKPSISTTETIKNIRYTNTSMSKLFETNNSYKKMLESISNTNKGVLPKNFNPYSKLSLNSIGLINKSFPKPSMYSGYSNRINYSSFTNSSINKALINANKFNSILGNMNISNTYKYSVIDQISKNLKYIKSPYFSNISKFNYKVPSSYLYSNINKSIYFDKLVVPNNHLGLLDKIEFKDNFTATKIINQSTYLKRRDSEEYTDINSISDVYALYDENLGFSEKELYEFIRYIQNTPMLILNHKIGKKIFDEIQDFNIELFDTEDKLTLYKTRTKRDKFPFSYEQMSITPYDVSRGGRFDSYGQSLLYTANLKEVSLLEVSDENAKYYHVQHYLYNNDLKLADFTKVDSYLLDILLRPITSNNYQEYILPRFIAECIKSGGYDGLVIRSSKSLEHRNDLNFNLFQHATVKLERGNYEILSNKEADSIMECYE